MSNKNKNNLTIGIDIRNIGRKRTGSEVVVLELTKNILKIDAGNKYVLLTDTDDEKIISYIKKVLNLNERNNAEIVSVKAGNKFTWSAWALPRWARKNHLDIYHTEYILPFFMPRDTKLITHIHDVSFKVYRKFISWKDLLFLDVLIPWTIKKADKIIAVSEFTKNEIVKFYKVNPSKIEVVYNSTNLPKKDEVSDKKDVIKKFGLPKKFIFYVGTLQPRKNVALLIEAFAGIKDKLPGMKLVIAGDKNGYNFDKRIDEVIKKYNLNENEVLFIGFVDVKDKAMIYSLARLVVTPSFYEGFGIVPLEAIERAAPVLVSDIPVHREIYSDAAIYFNPKKLDELRNKLYSVCTDEKLRNDLIKRGFIRSSFFSWKKSAERMLEAYKEIA